MTTIEIGGELSNRARGNAKGTGSQIDSGLKKPPQHDVIIIGADSMSTKMIWNGLLLSKNFF